VRPDSCLLYSNSSLYLEPRDVCFTSGEHGNCPDGFGCGGATATSLPGNCRRLLGRSCVSTGDCVRGVCSAEKFCCNSNCPVGSGCDSSGTCLALNGGTCTSTADCLIGTCNGTNASSLRCCPAGCSCTTQGVCLLELGAVCSAADSCGTGICSDSGHCCPISCSGSCQSCKSGRCESICDNSGAIAAGVVVSLIAIAAAAILVVLFYRRQRRMKDQLALQALELTEDMKVRLFVTIFCCPVH
jgi:hypothetical protein